MTGDRSQLERSPRASSQPAAAQHFARDRRIVKTDEFSSVFRLRPRVRTSHFMLYARDNGLPQARLGIVVAKRLAPRAVTRNMIKRVARELFRHSALPATDCIVRLSRPINSRDEPARSSLLKQRLRSELHELFAALNPPDPPR